MSVVRGSVTLIGLLASLFAFAFFMAIVVLGQQKSREIRERMKAYLCFKEHIVETRRYIRKIGKTNMAIQTAFTASLLPGGKAAAGTIKILKSAQTAIHVAHARKLMALKHCPIKLKLQFTKKIPYQLTQTAIFKRWPNGITKIRRKTWNTLVKKGDILLRADWKMHSSLDTDSIPKTREEGLSWWRLSYGFP